MELLAGLVFNVQLQNLLKQYVERVHLDDMVFIQKFIKTE